MNFLEQLLENESNLVQYWLSNDVPLKKATDEWFKGISGVVAPYEPCANFKNEIEQYVDPDPLFKFFTLDPDPANKNFK